MERTVKMGVIGCGPRGAGLIKTICACENAEIVAVCDLYQDRVDNAIAVVQRKRGNTPDFLIRRVFTWKTPLRQFLPKGSDQFITD